MSVAWTTSPEGFLPKQLLNRFWNNESNPQIYPLLGTKASIEPLMSQIADQFDQSKRKTLVEVLKQQYGKLLTKELETRIDGLLSENTYTVTTGQQIHPFLGPMYVWAKIISAINSAEVLNKQYPSKNFIPVFWMASEDHDFEEIAKWTVFGTEYEWKTNQTGPVGEFHLSDLQPIFEQINQKLERDQEAQKRWESLVCNYKNPNSNLADATRNLVHALFGHLGLIILDPNNYKLKSMCIDLWSADIVDHKVHSAISKQNEILTQAGEDTPAFVREINCFWMTSSYRERIKEDTVFDNLPEVDSSSPKFSKEWFINNAAHLSPNVLLRPLYQQSILPNVIYIGGPAEVKYWQQTTLAFRELAIPTPRLQMRLNCVYISASNLKKLEKHQITEEVMWSPWSDLQYTVLESQLGKYSLDTSIEQLKLGFEQTWKSLYEISHPELSAIKKSHEEVLKSLKKISSKYKNPETAEGPMAQVMHSIKAIKQSTFNTEIPQERTLFWLDLFLKGIDVEISELNREIQQFAIIR